jgi:hypothetical protein
LQLIIIIIINFPTRVTQNIVTDFARNHGGLNQNFEIGTWYISAYNRL